MSSYGDEWVQFYNQISSMDNEDHHHVIASSISISDATLVAESESILSPKGLCVSKPISVRSRRSSRASKKTPTTTLLNVNIDNFRALVQQFTGCPCTSSSFSFIGSKKKGPVNLSFGPANDQGYASTSVAANFGKSTYYYSDNNHQSRHQQQQLQQVWQGQQSLVSFDNVGNDAIFETASNNNYCNPNGSTMNSDMFHEYAFYSGSRRNDTCLL